MCFKVFRPFGLFLRHRPLRRLLAHTLELAQSVPNFMLGDGAGGLAIQPDAHRSEAASRLVGAAVGVEAQGVADLHARQRSRLPDVRGNADLERLAMTLKNVEALWPTLSQHGEAF